MSKLRFYLFLAFLTFFLSMISVNIYADKEFVAVADFSGYNILQTEAASFSDFLRAALSDKNHFFVVDRKEVLSAKRKANIIADDITVKNAIKLGETLAVDKIIVGSVSRFRKLGEYYFISADIIDIKTGKVYISEDMECKNISEFKLVAKDMAKNILREMGFGVPMSPKWKATKKKRFDKRYNKLGVGVGYPFFSVIWGLFPKWNIEPKAAFGSGIFTFGARLNYRIRDWEKIELFTGLEYLYILFEGEGLDGTGAFIEPLIGANYYIHDKIAFSMDLGPSYLFLKETKYSIKKFGDIILNIQIKLFIT